MSAHPELPRVPARALLDRMDEPPAPWVKIGAALLGALGIFAFAAALVGDPTRAWTALVWNWVFFSGVSIGGAVVVAAATTAHGGWIRPLRRFAEALTAFLPVSWLLMVVLFFGIEHVYTWVEHPPPAKASWLNPTFFTIRQLVAVTLLYGLALRLVYWSLRPDVGRLRDRVDGARRRLYDRLSGGWRGLDEEIALSHERRARLAPAVCGLYAVLWSFMAWDWLMSIDPHWFSTLFAAWVFMGHFLAALGATAILACILRGSPSIAPVVTPRALHDIGKMVFAFTVFWTYLFFSQYLVIWYGRLPEETGFVKLRLWGVYEPIATIVLLAVFLVPFLGLLGVRPKRTPSTLTAFATISLLGLWLWHFLLVEPGPFPDTLMLGWVELAVGAGFLGVFTLCVLAFLSAFPALAITAGVPLEDDAAAMADRQETES